MAVGQAGARDRSGADTGEGGRRNSTRQVLVASLVGTSIEFYDFYVYATAAVLVFPHLFFPAGDDTAATLQSLATSRSRSSPARSALPCSDISVIGSAARPRSSPRC